MTIGGVLGENCAHQNWAMMSNGLPEKPGFQRKTKKWLPEHASWSYFGALKEIDLEPMIQCQINCPLKTQLQDGHPISEVSLCKTIFVLARRNQRGKLRCQLWSEKPGAVQPSRIPAGVFLG